MRCFLIIFSAVLLLAINFTGCRKNKQPASARSTAGRSSVQSIPQSDTNKGDVQNIEITAITNSHNQPNEPNFAGEAAKSADQNIPADPNYKNVKSGTEPNSGNLKNQDLKPLEKFQKDYSEVLSENVDSRGYVNYRKLKIRRSAMYNLLEQLKRFDSNDFKAMSNDDKIAFWINAYNIKMLSTIIDNYPIESNPLSRIFGWQADDVRYIDKKVGGLEKQKILIMNEEFTLEDIEQNIFYKQLMEPKAYFAIIHCGISGPPLRNEPYNGKKLYEQLDDQIKKYLSDRANFRIDPDNRKVWLPAILQGSWYGKYFTDKYGTDKKFKDQRPEVAAVLNCIIKYLSPNDSSYLELKNYIVDFIPYNWKINDQ